MMEFTMKMKKRTEPISVMVTGKFTPAMQQHWADLIIRKVYGLDAPDVMEITFDQLYELATTKADKSIEDKFKHACAVYRRLPAYTELDRDNQKKVRASSFRKQYVDGNEGIIGFVDSEWAKHQEQSAKGTAFTF